MRIRHIAKLVMQRVFSIIPPKKNLWIFGAWRGMLYSDNTKYLFEFVADNHDDIYPVWITKKKELVNDIRKLGYNCYYYLSIKGILITLRAEAAFETEGEQDISPIMNWRTKIFLLWHGLGVKDLRWKDEYGKLPSEKTYKDYKRYIWFSTSEYFTEILSKQFYLPKDNYYITGFARNDTFIIKPKNSEFEILTYNWTYDKKIIYMPTHRNFGKDGNTFINIDSLAELNELLRKKNWILVFKPHIHELQNIMAFGRNYSNIEFAVDTSLWGDPYSYLYYFDALVTDYSSVASDYICSGKPVVLFPYDLEQYKENDGGLLPVFYEYPAGPCCFTWDEVIATLDGLFHNDTWRKQREKCREHYHIYNDGYNRERNYSMAVELLRRNK